MSSSKVQTMATGTAVVAGLTLTALTAPVAAAAPSTPNVSGYDRPVRKPQFLPVQDINEQGHVVGLQGEHRTIPLDLDNRTSSIRNLNGRVWSVYTGTNFTGTCLSIAATYTGNITQYGGMNDQISSARPGACPA